MTELLNTSWRLSRQAQMVSHSISELKVCIVGVGGIGSNAAHLLASMGVVDITLVDFDMIADENLYPGFFSQLDLEDGMSKVDAVADDIEARYGIRCLAIRDYIEDAAEKLAGAKFDIVIVGTDSLASRREAWHALKDSARFWIDARMGGPGCDVYALDTKSMVMFEYEETMRRPEGQLPCGMKATAFITKGYILGFIGDVVRDIANGNPFAYHFRYDADDKIMLIDSPDPNNRNWLSFRLGDPQERANGGGDNELADEG